jgi:hypothetical protein
VSRTGIEPIPTQPGSLTAVPAQAQVVGRSWWAHEDLREARELTNLLTVAAVEVRRG